MNVDTTTATTSSGFGGVVIAIVLIALVLVIIGIAALWRIFTKAGRPGWAAIIPVYNVYVMLKVAGRPGWWLLLYLVPVVNIVVHLMVALDLARSFGRSATFGVVGLWLFSYIGYCVLGFGGSRYRGPAALRW